MFNTNNATQLVNHLLASAGFQTVLCEGVQAGDAIHTATGGDIFENLQGVDFAQQDFPAPVAQPRDDAVCGPVGYVGDL